MNAIEAGKAFIKFILEDKEFHKSLKGLGTKLQNVGKIGATATAPIVAGFAAATTAALSFGDGVGDMSARTGIAARELSALSFAADQSDVSVSTLERGIRKMTVNIGNAISGTGTFGKTLDTLGVSITELQALSPDQQFLRLSDALAQLPDPAQRAAIAQQVFGKAAAEMAPLLDQGSAGITTLMQQAEALGVVLSEKDVAALGELDQALKMAKTQVFGLSVQIGSAVAGPLTDFLKALGPIVAGTINWIRENPNLVKTIAVVTTAISACSVAAYGLGTAMTFIAAHPVIAKLAALTAVVIALNEAMANFTNARLDADAAGMQKELDETRKALAEMDELEKNGFKAPAVAAPQEIAAAAKAGVAAGTPAADVTVMDQAAMQNLAMMGLDFSKLVGLGERSNSLLQSIDRKLGGGGFVAGTE